MDPAKTTQTSVVMVFSEITSLSQACHNPDEAFAFSSVRGEADKRPTFCPEIRFEHFLLRKDKSPVGELACFFQSASGKDYL
jgi:hypothetical protein